MNRALYTVVSGDCCGVHIRMDGEATTSMQRPMWPIIKKANPQMKLWTRARTLGKNVHQPILRIVELRRVPRRVAWSSSWRRIYFWMPIGGWLSDWWRYFKNRIRWILWSIKVIKKKESCSSVLTNEVVYMPAQQPCPIMCRSPELYSFQRQKC